MKYTDNRYAHLSSYQDIYQELIYQRNSAIDWLNNYALTKRDRRVEKSDKDELTRHHMANVYRPIFRENILHLLDRLYTHDATEALFDLETADLGDWSETEANWLEREIQRLQLIISKLEARYDLQYRIIFEYDSKECVLYMSRNKVFSCGQTTQKHRVLSALFSNPQKQWSIEDFDKFFAKEFNRGRYILEKRSLEKTGNDIKAQVAIKTGVKDFLLVSSSSLRINPNYVQ